MQTRRAPSRPRDVLDLARIFTLISLGAAALAGCGSGPDASTSTATATGGAGGGASGSGGATSSSPDGGAPTTRTVTCTLGGPPDDMDGDGVSPEQGDCDDCDSGVSPLLPELSDDDKDDDCDGQVDEPLAPCDADLALDSTDPYDAARAIELCKQAASDDDWGLIDARWTMPSGEPLTLADPAPYHIGHGIVPDFGPNVLPRAGSSMLLLSSGAARRPTDPGYSSPDAGSRGYAHQHAFGHPHDSPACPGQTFGPAFDGVALEVTLRMPSNANTVRARFDFYSWEFPSRLCSKFDDALVGTAIHEDGTLFIEDFVFDPALNDVTVNNVWFSVCDCGAADPCILGNHLYDCDGTAELLGTGFETAGGPHAATGWFRSGLKVEPGNQVTLRFSVYDVSDDLGASTAIVDDIHFGFLPNQEQLP